MACYINGDILKTERVFPQQGRGAYARYDMNENPEGLPKEFADSVLREITPGYLATYPEPDAFTGKYAQFVNVEFDNVLATNGSDMAIRYLLETFCEKGCEVVTAAPSFEMYWVNCSILGLRHVPVSYEDDLTIDVRKIVKAIGPRTDVVVLLNPNNPVGNAYSRDEVQLVVEAAQENDALVIIDEAYHYFYDQTFIDMALEHPNVVVLRTFSKLFSLAACRLGVIVGNSSIIDCVKKAKLTFDVNAIALKFGERILDDRGLVQKLIASEKEGRAHLIRRLRGEGYDLKDCKGNFLLIRTKREPADVAKDLEEQKKILVKYWTEGILAPYLRVSTGSVEAMESFVAPFLEIDGR